MVYHKNILILPHLTVFYNLDKQLLQLLL